jgi:hypothetical protein
VPGFCTRQSEATSQEIEVAAGVEGHNRLKVCRTAAGLKPMAENDAIGATSPENGSFADAALRLNTFPLALSGLTPSSLFVLIPSLRRWGAIMRKVEIVEDPRSQRCWVAVDVKSGEPVMRLHDRHLLERLCDSLEWRVVQKEREGSRNGLG